MAEQLKNTIFGKIPQEWEVKTVHELVIEGYLHKPLDGNHGNIHPKGDDFVEEGIPFIMASDLKGGKVDLKNCKFIAQEQADRLQKGFSYPGDVLLTHKATMGRTALVADIPTDYIMLTPQVTYYRVKDENKLNNRYLKLFFDSKPFQKLFLSWSDSGSTRSYMGITAQRELPIIIPPISQQKAIAKILSDLDDKIALNQSINRNLEKMAKALYKQWFVDFEFPNEKGKPYKSNGGAFKEDDLFGEIPEEWVTNSFEDQIEVVRGLSYKGAGLTDKLNGIPMNNLNSVYEGGGYKYEGVKYYKGDYKDKHLTKPGDIIVANTEQGHKYLLIGYPAIVPEWTGDKSIFSHHLYRLRPKDDSYLQSEYLYYLVLSNATHLQIIGCTNGTTVNMLQIDGLKTPRFPLPPQKTVEQFVNVIRPILKKKEKNQNEIFKLEKLRNTLLPKLISGELIPPSP